MIPQSITVNEVNLTLGSPVALELEGNINITYAGFINQASGFSLSTNLMVGPSGDAKDPSLIVSVIPSSASSADLTLDALLLLPPAAVAIAQFAADALASQIQSELNNLIVQLATAALLGFKPPLQMTPTATMSLGRLIISSEGLNAVLVIGDIFGSAIEPVPVPKFPRIEVAPQWNCGVAESYTITITDSASGSPIPDALVHLTVFTSSSASSTLSGNTDAAGQVKFSDVVVKSFFSVSAIKGNVVATVHNCQLTVLASGFNTTTVGITCPI